MCKKYYMVLDIEIVVDVCIFYDVVSVIVDCVGNVIEWYNVLVKEVFDNPIMRHMFTAVFKRHEKLDTAPVKFVTHHPVWKKRLKTH